MNRHGGNYQRGVYNRDNVGANAYCGSANFDRSLEIDHSASNPETATLASLLEQTSRTFALAIPCLHQPLQNDVTVAYLLFRIADTIEDAPHLSQGEKLAALGRLADMTPAAGNAPVDGADLQLPRPPSHNPHHLELMAEAELVFRALQRLPTVVQQTITAHAERSIRGMQRFIGLGSDQGMVRIRTIEEVRDYCYCVAGLVGEMLTSIFVQRVPELAPYRTELWHRSRWFGEGLQLVNMLKDSDEDEQDGRLFVADESQRQQLFELARADLKLAEEYVELLQSASAPSGLLGFSQLPLQLAWRTLECVEQGGPGSKVPRSEVEQLVASLARRSDGDGD